MFLCVICTLSAQCLFGYFHTILNTRVYTQDCFSSEGGAHKRRFVFTWTVARLHNSIHHFCGSRFVKWYTLVEPITFLGMWKRVRIASNVNLIMTPNVDCVMFWLNWPRPPLSRGPGTRFLDRSYTRKQCSHFTSRTEPGAQTAPSPEKNKNENDPSLFASRLSLFRKIHDQESNLLQSILQSSTLAVVFQVRFFPMYIDLHKLAPTHMKSSGSFLKCNGFNSDYLGKDWSTDLAKLGQT